MSDPASFSDVDSAAVDPLVEMMAATDAWPAVRAARRWTLDRVTGAEASGPLLDVGCGPGTFGASARADGWATVEMDRSVAMLGELRRRRGVTPVAVADVAGLPVRDASAGLVRGERVLQWTDDPDAGLVELCRVAAPGGWVAVTDTDWSTFAVDAPEAWMSQALADAALGWVPHPTFATTVAERLRRLGAVELHERSDRVDLTRWDPDDPAQLDGPPGLPLHSIAAGATPEHRERAQQAVDEVARAASAGSFGASLTIVTVLARP